jgi:hypothetical protein
MPPTSELDLVVEELNETDWDQIVSTLIGADPENYGDLEIQACGCGFCESGACFGGSCDGDCDGPLP